MYFKYVKRNCKDSTRKIKINKPKKYTYIEKNTEKKNLKKIVSNHLVLIRVLFVIFILSNGNEPIENLFSKC